MDTIVTQVGETGEALHISTTRAHQPFFALA